MTSLFRLLPMEIYPAEMQEIPYRVSHFTTFHREIIKPTFYLIFAHTQDTCCKGISCNFAAILFLLCH